MSGGDRDGFVAHFSLGGVQPGGLQVAVVPLVEVAHQRVGFLAEGVHDWFAGEADLQGQNAILYKSLGTAFMLHLRFWITVVIRVDSHVHTFQVSTETTA